MRKDVKRILSFSTLSTVAALFCGVIARREFYEYENKGFAVSDDYYSPGAAAYLTIGFGFAAILGFAVAFIFYSEDKQYDESLKDNSQSQLEQTDKSSV